MSLILFFDTETSGLPLFKEPSEHPDQPHIVQLAAALVDSETRKTVHSVDLIACPTDWVIPEEVSAIHGITTEYAIRVGVPEVMIVDILMAMHERANVRVAHNESFDCRIGRIALKRFYAAEPELADAWKSAPAECTALMATPICAIAPTAKMQAVGRQHHKKPNLREAYRHCFGIDFEDAHTALADVNACMAVYWYMKDLDNQKEPATA